MLINLKKTRLLATAAIFLLLGGHAAKAQTTADVIVYGSTPGGYCAAIAAAREGAAVILLEPTAHVGGMNTGGLSHCDSNQMYRETVMGLFHEWHTRVVQDYTDRGLTAPYNPAVKDQSRWTFEPHVATRVTNAMLAEAGVTVLTGRYLQSVNKTGPRITSIVTSNGDFSARCFVDGSYEGDLMAAAGISWTIGREGTAEFGESRAGKQYPKSSMNIDGFDSDGNPLPLITGTDAVPAPDGDDNLMTYSFRLSLTSAANKIAMPAPDNYDPARFEVMRRHVAAGGNSIGFDRYPVPGGKVDGNNSIGRQFSLGLVGGGKGWATADEAGRAAIFEAHKQYTLEFLHFLSNDPVFSAAQRASNASWGLCADEFADTGHFPPQLYVRESRRMQGMYVVKQSDIINNPTKTDPIMVSSFPIDSHDCQRIATPGGGVRNEGTIFPVRQGGRGYPYQVPYRAILPVPAECDNLLVPVALSCTHVGISSLRIEGTWMLLGQSAGIAAALAADQDVTVQDLPYTDLKTRLLAQGQVLDLPAGFQPPEALTGIVLDDPEAALAGTWSSSTTISPYVGAGYRYAGAADTPNDGSAVATFRFTAPEAGTYQLNMAYSPHETRASKVPLTITSGPHVKNLTVDQTVARPAGSVVRAIGTVELVAGQESVITVGSAGTTGFVILDAIQLTLEDGDPDPEPTHSGVFQEGVSPTGGYTHDAVMIRSRVDNDADDSNQDGAGSIIIGSAASGSELIRGLFEFDISDIATSSPVASVALILTTLRNQAGINDVGDPGALSSFNVYAYGYDIDETNATWNAPAAGDVAGGSLGALLSSASFDTEITGQTITFGDTPAFRAAVADALVGDGFLRLIVANSDETNLGSHDFARFHDESAANASDRPELRVISSSAEICITGLDYSPADDLLTLSWTSRAGESYRVNHSPDLIEWDNVLHSGISPDAGKTTSKTFDLKLAGIAAERRVFFRVEKE